MRRLAFARAIATNLRVALPTAGQLMPICRWRHAQRLARDDAPAAASVPRAAKRQTADCSPPPVCTTAFASPTPPAFIVDVQPAIAGRFARQKSRSIESPWRWGKRGGGRSSRERRQTNIFSANSWLVPIIVLLAALTIVTSVCSLLIFRRFRAHMRFYFDALNGIVGPAVDPAILNCGIWTRVPPLPTPPAPLATKTTGDAKDIKRQNSADSNIYVAEPNAFASPKSDDERQLSIVKAAVESLYAEIVD